MPRTLSALFDSEAEAEQALSAIGAEVPLIDSAVLSSGPAGAFTLDSLELTEEERATCEQQVAGGGFLLVAQVESDGAASSVLALLDEMGSRNAIAQAPQLPTAAPPTPVPPLPKPEAEAPKEEVPAAAEERVPIVEEELRIGKRQVLRGGARVHTYTAEIPVREQVELAEEHASVERRPANRRLTEEELAKGGLLRDRVIEFPQMREEPVISKEAFVREELIIRKSVERRIEQIDETVRRTQVETERIPAEGAAEAPDRRPEPSAR
jgi:stress response protein YsnF